MTDWVLVALLGFVVVAAVFTALATRVLTTLAAFGAYSLGLAVVWLVFRAPDVALTEAAVGAGVTTGLFLVVAARTVGLDFDRETLQQTESPHGSDTSDNSNNSDGLNYLHVFTEKVRPNRIWSLVVALGVTAGLLLTVSSLPVVGASDAPGFGSTTEFFIADSASRGIENVVTAILVVYRGFDTFGELAVVFTAAVAVIAILRQESTR